MNKVTAASLTGVMFKCTGVCVCVCVRVCVFCVRVCMCACMHACVRACVCLMHAKQMCRPFL